jgi:pimeloyl-ACP methyl ester carboxylesterase
MSTSVPTTPPTTPDDHTAWVAGGTRVTVTGAAAAGRQSADIFVRTRGAGPAITLIHGFPSSSWEWEGLEQALSSRFTVVTFDLLGYGASDKPAGHRFSCHEHADIVEAVWRHLSIKSTALVGHDVGGTIVQELLDRSNRGRLPVCLQSASILNSALFADHYQPLLITRLLARPRLGQVIGRLMTERSFSASLRRTFAPEHQPSDSFVAQVWANLNLHAPSGHLPRLLHYIGDKRRNRERWEAATEATTVPLQVIWGLADTALSPEIARDIERHLPAASITLLEGTGHFPHLEASAQVADLVAGFATAAPNRFNRQAWGGPA